MECINFESKEKVEKYQISLKDKFNKLKADYFFRKSI